MLVWYVGCECIWGTPSWETWCYSLRRKAYCMQMADDTKRRIILENSWVYLKGSQCFVSEDRTISQQNDRRKAYEERLKNKVKDLGKDGNGGK